MIAWVDIEASGLDERCGHLLEVGIVLTDDSLREIASMDVQVLPVGVTIDQMIATCEPVVREMHEKSGLFADLRERGLRRYEAEQKLLDFVVDVFMTGAARRCEDRLPKFYLRLSVNASELLRKTPLAGATVGFDRMWLREHMPLLERLFSYRSIDVTSLGEIARRMSPVVYARRPWAISHDGGRTCDAHRALLDVRQVIAAFRYYRRTLLREVVHAPMLLWSSAAEPQGVVCACGAEPPPGVEADLWVAAHVAETQESQP